MRPLRIERMGTDAQGITLRGDPRSPEPTHVRVAFPGGDVDVVRATDGTYWVHVRRNRPDDAAVVADGAPVGVIEGARLDIEGKPVSESDVGDFAHPGLYHLAVRVGRRGPG